MAKAKTKEITFVKGNMATILWDPSKNKPIAEFEGGLFTTSDPYKIEALKKWGYKTKDDYPNGPPERGFEDQKTTMPPPRALSKSIPSTLKQDPGESDTPAPAKKPDKKARATTQKAKKKKATKKKTIKRRSKSTG